VIIFERGKNMESNHPMKHVSDSKTEQIQIIMPAQINGYDRLFGGQLVEWIDILAAVVARRHSNRNVTTVTIDNLNFKEAAHVNNTIVLVGRITYVGNTSMEVMVETFVEKLSGEKKLINRAYLMMVALDKDENPVTVPGLILETDEEKQEWEAGVRRCQLRKQRREEQF
jgi:acyl-CoA hydrolase